MDKKEWEEILYTQDRQLLLKCQLPEHEELLDAVRSLIPTTGTLQYLFCNGFMLESVEMLKHALFLYEDGYFDCAFYSLRQAVENMNSMLLLADDEERLNQWKSKAWFPMDSKVKTLLEKQNNAYREIQEKIPEFFQEYKELLEQANKYIHKQGFDTFYVSRNIETVENRNERTLYFVRFLKNSIGMILIVNIALDPLSLALSDPDVDEYIPFDPWTEPIPIKLFDQFLSTELIDKIKETEHYKSLKNYFLSQEKLNRATYLVRRCNYYDVSCLEEIESQCHLLDFEQILILNILKLGIKASCFYTQYDIIGYSTSYEPSVHIREYSSNQFDAYMDDTNTENIPWKGMFISIYKALDSYLIIQHNNKFSDEECSIISLCVDKANIQYQSISVGCAGCLSEMG